MEKTRKEIYIMKEWGYFWWRLAWERQDADPWYRFTREPQWRHLVWRLWWRTDAP